MPDIQSRPSRLSVDASHRPRGVSLYLVPLIAAIAMPARADILIEPMRARNLSPSIVIFGVPSWDGGLDAGTRSRFTITGDMASHFRFVEEGPERLILDGETWRANLVYERQATDRWTFAVELPLVRQSGGVLDNVIDAWHSAFHLPDGNRNSRPEDELQFYYDNGPGPGYFLSQAANGFGDMQLSVARALGSGGDWRLKFTLKLPTGDADILAGSGSTDFAVSLSHGGATTWRSRPAGWFWGVGLLAPGQPDTFPGQSRDWVALGMAGVSWWPFARLGFKAQLDVHTDFYDSRLEEFGDAAMQATVGGWWAFDERRALTAAVIEDLIVRAAPDVSLQLGFQWSF